MKMRLQEGKIGERYAMKHCSKSIDYIHHPVRKKDLLCLEEDNTF